MTEKTKKYLVATITGIGPGNPERLVLRTLKGRTITVQMVQGSLKKICAEEGIASPKELLKKVVAFDEGNSTFGFFENTMSEFQTKDYDKPGFAWGTKDDTTQGRGATVMASQKHQACQGEPAYEVMKKALESLRDYQWRPSRRGRNLVPVSEVENMSTLASRALKRVEAEETKGPETE